MFGQFKIIENIHMVEDGEPYEKRRTWKERLFTLPWDPLRKTKIIVPKVPMKSFYKTWDGAIIMHPEMAKELRRQIELT